MNKADFFRPENFRTYTPASGYWCGAMASLAYDRHGTVAPAFEAAYGEKIRRFDLGFVDLLTGHLPAFTRYSMDNIDFWCIEGTTDQWLQYLRIGGSSTNAIGSIPLGEHYEMFLPYYYPHVMHIYNEIVRLGYGGKPTVFVGHSLGGAIATALADLFVRTNWNVVAAYSFGSPKVGSERYYRAYQGRHFRVYAPNDLVPDLPPARYWYLTQSVAHALMAGEPVHIGNPVRVAPLDTEEIDQRTNGGGTYLGLFRVPSWISAHFMGAYMESLYAPLVRSQKEFFHSAYQALTASNLHTSPTHAPEFPSKVQRDQLTAEYRSQELEQVERMIGNAGYCKIRLYTSPFGVTPGDTGTPVVEADFPGYAPIAIPDTFRIDRMTKRVTRTDSTSFNYILPEDLPETVMIAGVYVTMANNTGGESILTVQPLRKPRGIKEKGDRIRGTIRLEVARVGVAT